MKKSTKGALALLAAALLLLGGAGTLAFWSDNADLDGGEIEAGTLELTAEEGTWSNELDLWVPGDDETYTADLVLLAEGDNIQGNITYDPTSIVLPSEGADQFDITLEPASSLPAGVTYADDVISFDGPGTYTIPVEVTVSFPFLSEAQNDSQGVTVDLSEIAFTATQTAAPGAVTP